MPGWVMPVNLTPGMCRDVHFWPAVEVPDRLVGVGEVVGQEAAAVHLGEDAGVAPALTGRVTDLLRDRAEIEDVDDEQVAGLGALDRRPARTGHVGEYRLQSRTSLALSLLPI